MGIFWGQRIEVFLSFEPGMQLGKFVVYMAILLVPMAGLMFAYMYFMKITGLAKLEAYRAALSGNLWARPRVPATEEEASKKTSNPET